MIDIRNIDSEVKVVVPFNLGWLEKKLSKEEMSHLWKIINNKGESYKNQLAGVVYESNSLIDEGEWFFENTLKELIHIYAREFVNLGHHLPTSGRHPYYLNNMWVNFQRKHDYNPLHRHKGIYSFVVWMKIPTRHEEQNKNNASKGKSVSAFSFFYTNNLGEISNYVYEMRPECEGTILFFPSQLNHSVYPFYECDEDRISISGNILLRTEV